MSSTRGYYTWRSVNVRARRMRQIACCAELLLLMLVALALLAGALYGIAVFAQGWTAWWAQ